MRCWLLMLGLLGLVGCGSNDDANPQADKNEKPASAAPQTAATESKTSSKQRPAPADNPAVAQLLQQGRADAQAGRLAEAVEAFSQVIGLAPENAEAYSHRAQVYASVRQDANALADFSTALKLAPQDAKLYNTRGFFLLTRGKLDEAIADFDAAISYDPAYLGAHNNRGLALMGQSKYADAIAAFDQALAINPDYPEGLNNRGFAHFRSGEHDKAIADFNKAIQLKPDYVNPLSNLGVVYHSQENYEKAIECFTKSISRDKYNPQHYQYREEAYRKLGMEAEARADLEKVDWLKRLSVLAMRISREPQKPDLHLQRISLLLEENETEAALKGFEQLHQAFPRFARGFSARARYWFEQNDFDRAIADCDKSLAVEDNHEAHSIRGDAWLAKGDFDKAIDDYTAAKRFDGNVARAYLLRSRALQKSGAAEQAAADRERALALDPQIESRLQ